MCAACRSTRRMRAPAEREENTTSASECSQATPQAYASMAAAGVGVRRLGAGAVQRVAEGWA